MPGKDVLVFDLNETLLDMSGLDPEFVRLFDDAGVRKTWFQQVVELFMSATIVGDYRSFDKLTDDALVMVAAQRGTTLTDGLGELIERVLSADAVQRYKPAREAYEYAARELGLPLESLRLVAAHGWDIAGALNAGCKAAFVARPGKVLGPAARQPDISVKDLRELAERLSGP